MSRYRFELATPADDADLRHVLAATPMQGWISLAFQREPSWLAASVVEGDFVQVVVARDLETGRVVGFGSRSVRQRYVNGVSCGVGYLSNLRLLAEFRNRGLVARGYRFFRELHQDDRACFYLTTIAEDNLPAIKLLTSGRAGLPAYHDAGRFLTAALRGKPKGPETSALQVRSAQKDDWPELLRFWQAEGPRRQFFPDLREADFFNPKGAFRDLEPAALLLAYRKGRLAGTLGCWDQRSFRQMVVHRYHPVLHLARPVYNAWAGWTGQPRLPRTGQPLSALMGCLSVIGDNDPEVFAELIRSGLGKIQASGAEVLLVGLHEKDPLLSVLRKFPARWYGTRLYVVAWPEDKIDLEPINAIRVPYLELGGL